MLGGIVKLTLLLNVLFLFIVLFWQAATIDASPIMTNNGNSMKINDDQKPRGALVVKRSLHSNVSRFRHRRMKKNSNKHRTSKRIQTIVDDRLKRFRMLDPDEFQEMLNSWSYQVPDQSVKELDNMDTIGGMQLENYWLRK